MKTLFEESTRCWY